MEAIEQDFFTDEELADMEAATDLDARFETGEYDPESIADMIDDPVDLLTDAALERKVYP